jgi:hypothetical protein
MFLYETQQERANRTISSQQTEFEAVSKDLEAEKASNERLMKRYDVLIQVQQAEHQRFLELQASYTI